MNTKVHQAYIAVGSNLGDRGGYIHSARRLLQADAGIELNGESSVIETEPLGGVAQNNYLNTIWRVSTTYTPIALLEVLLSIEHGLGRRRGERNASRIIDLDILFYDTQIIRQPDLVVPHERLHERDFILALMCEFDAELRHPVFQKTIRQLLEELRNESCKD